jgi:hypothetical protein
MAIERYYDGTKWVYIKDGNWSKVNTIDATTRNLYSFALPINSQEVIIVMDTDANGKITNTSRMMQLPIALIGSGLTLPSFANSTIIYASNNITIEWDIANPYCVGKYITVWAR